jgi:glutathione S-transferase
MMKVYALAKRQDANVPFDGSDSRFNACRNIRRECVYKLYTVKAWGSVAPHLLLEEFGVPYESIWMTAEQVAAPAYRAIHPLGMIPAMALPDGQIMFESAAIVAYHVSAHPDKGMAPPPGSPDHGMFLTWLNFMSTNIYPAVSSPEKSDPLFAILERKLGQAGPWLMGANYSALDSYLFMLPLWARPSEEALHGRFPRIAALAQRVRARPGLKKALEAQGVLKVGGYGG